MGVMRYAAFMPCFPALSMAKRGVSASKLTIASSSSVPPTMDRAPGVSSSAGVPAPSSSFSSDSLSIRLCSTTRDRRPSTSALRPRTLSPALSAAAAGWGRAVRSPSAGLARKERLRLREETESGARGTAGVAAVGLRPEPNDGDSWPTSSSEPSGRAGVSSSAAGRVTGGVPERAGIGRVWAEVSEARRGAGRGGTGVGCGCESAPRKEAIEVERRSRPDFREASRAAAARPLWRAETAPLKEARRFSGLEWVRTPAMRPSEVWEMDGREMDAGGGCEKKVEVERGEREVMLGFQRQSYEAYRTQSSGPVRRS